MKKFFFAIIAIATTVLLNSSDAENWNLNGIWTGEANGYAFRMVLNQTGQDFTGQYQDLSGQGDPKSSLTGSVDFQDNSIRFTRTFPSGDVQTYTGFVFWGWTKGRGIAGTFGAGSGSNEASWFARR